MAFNFDQLVILLGPPGVGKGTLSRNLERNLNFFHTSTGDLFRRNITEETPLGIKIRPYMDAGTFVPDEITLEVIYDLLRNLDGEGKLLFDGFPRTIDQAEEFGEMVHVDTALYLEVGKNLLQKRLTGRRTCGNCGEIYNLYYKPPKIEGFCDNCDSGLKFRNDDKEEYLEKRFEDYHTLTMPLVSFYESQGVLRKISGEFTPLKVFESAKLILDTNE